MENEYYSINNSNPNSPLPSILHKSKSTREFQSQDDLTRLFSKENNNLSRKFSETRNEGSRHNSEGKNSIHKSLSKEDLSTRTRSQSFNNLEDGIQKKNQIGEDEFEIVHHALEEIQKMKIKSSFNTIYYYYFHICYIIMVGFIGGFFIYYFEKGRVPFLDSLFTSFSSVTVSGLLTVNIITLSFSSKIVILFCVVLGMATLTTVPLMIIKLFDAKNHEHLEESGDHHIEYWAYFYSIIILLVIQIVIITCGITILGLYFDYLKVKDPWFSSLFLSVTSFANAGYTPFRDGLVDFKHDIIINVTVIILVIFGNTLFPSIYYFSIWICHTLPTSKKNVFRFILDHHHRMSIHLFPNNQTKVYLITSVIILFIGTSTCMIMEKDNPQVEGSFLISLFNTVNTRMAGIHSVDIGSFSLFTILVYIILMRIKTQMFCSLDEKSDIVEQISKDEKRLTTLEKFIKDRHKKLHYKLKVRKYSDRLHSHHDFLHSLTGIYTDIKERKTQSLKKHLLILLEPFIKLYELLKEESKNTNFWIGVAILALSFLESRHWKENINYGFIKIVFEVMSAYGNCGLSLGFPGITTSFSTAFFPFSKILIIVVMVAGRHRGFYHSMKDQVVDFHLSYHDEE